jgi:dienelactone hydrolase
MNNRTLATRWNIVFAALACILLTSTAQAELIRQIIQYPMGDGVAEGYVVYDNDHTALRPTVLIVHQWLGLSDYEKRRADMLAQLGYVAIAIDVYGKGVRAASPQEGGQLSSALKEDRDTLRKRLQAGLAYAVGHSRVDPRKIAVMGYCFGGTCALELARSGANITGVISFHGGLSTPKPAAPGSIAARVLVLHGADDPFVPPAELAAFQEEMKSAGTDWQLVAYGGAVHSFTDWRADGSFNPGARYNERADLRSWAALEQFLSDLFK